MARAIARVSTAHESNLAREGLIDAPVNLLVPRGVDLGLLRLIDTLEGEHGDLPLVRIERLARLDVVRQLRSHGSSSGRLADRRRRVHAGRSPRVTGHCQWPGTC